MSANNVPRVGQPIATVVNEGGGLVAKMNYWLQQTLRYLGTNPDNAVATPVVGASPFTLTNNGDFDQDVLIAGGTVSAVNFIRGGVSYPVNGTSLIRLNPGDSASVTYSVAPVIRVIPR